MSGAPVRRLEQELNEHRKEERDERGDSDVRATVRLLRGPSDDCSRAAGLAASSRIANPDHFLPLLVVLQGARLHRDGVGAASIQFGFGYETAIQYLQSLHVLFEAFGVCFERAMSLFAVRGDQERSGEIDHRCDKTGNGHE